MFKNLSPGALGICASLREALELARKTGFQGIELDMEEVARLTEKEGVDKVKQLFQDAGLKLGGWGLSVEWRKGWEVFQAGLKRLQRLAYVARELGCLRVFTWVLPFSDERPYEENFHWHIERFQPVAKVLKNYGCRLGLEFIGPKTSRINHRYEFIHTLQDMLKLCEAIGTGNVGLLLDSWHWYTSHGTLNQLEALRNEQVVYVHINDAPANIPVDEHVDNIRCLPGETGVIDLAGFLKALRKIGYDGPVTPEPFSLRVQQMKPLEAAKTTIEALNKVWRLAGLE